MELISQPGGASVGEYETYVYLFPVFISRSDKERHRTGKALYEYWCLPCHGRGPVIREHRHWPDDF